MGLFDDKKPRKKTLKYKVVVKGVTISKHYTKKQADSSAKSIYSAKVYKIGFKRGAGSKKYSRRY